MSEDSGNETKRTTGWGGYRPGAGRKKRARARFYFATENNQIIPFTLKSISEPAYPRSLNKEDENFLKNNNFIWPPFDRETVAKFFSQNTYHYRCVRAKAEDTILSGYEILPKAGKSLDEVKPEIETLEKFISDNDFFEIVYQLDIDLQTVGTAYLEVIRENYEPSKPVISVKRCKPWEIYVQKGRERFCQLLTSFGKRVYFSVFGSNKIINWKTGEFLSESNSEAGTEILEIKNFYPENDYYGIPDIYPAIGSILGIAYQRDYNLQFFMNFGIPSFLITITGDYDEGELDPTTNEPIVFQRIKQALEKIKEHPHSPLVLSIPGRSGQSSVNVKIEKISADIKESSFRAFYKDNRDEILTAHGVPGYRLGFIEQGSLGGSTARESSIIYRDSIIAPRKRFWERVLEKFVLKGLFLPNIWIYLKPYAFAQKEAEVDMLSKLFDLGAISPKEVRDYVKDDLDLPDIDLPAMNWHFIRGEPIEKIAEADKEIKRGIREIGLLLKTIERKK